MKCCICLKKIKLDTKIFKCTECQNSTHYLCYLKWIKEKQQCVCPYCNFNSDFSINHTINITEPTSSEENETSSSDESQLDYSLFESNAIYQAVQQIQENRGASRNIREGASNLELSRFVAMICLLFMIIGMFSIIIDSRNHIFVFNHTHHTYY